MSKVKLSSPWELYVKEIRAMFGEDPEINIEYDEDHYWLKLFVENQAKAEAIQKLLPTEKSFGNILVKIGVFPANKVGETKEELFRTALEGNPAFAFAKTVSGLFSNPITYVVFKNKVVQYFADNIGDIHGNNSTLYEEIAREIFDNSDGVYFCTDVE